LSTRSRRATWGAIALAVVLAIVIYGVELTGHSKSAAADMDNSNCPKTAADAHGWGQPNRISTFNDPDALASWDVYDTPGHDGNGRRTPSAMSVADGALTITADAAGNSGGMAWQPGQLHGRWEVCVKSLPSAATYHSVLLLWPDAEDWPVGGEIDFMEIWDPTRQSVDSFLHYGADNSQDTGNIRIDATQWHAWAVDWTADRIVMYVDGVPWAQYTNPGHIPPRPMHLCIQLDNFGGDTSAGGHTMVDWARQYPAA
jgi:hypothetical protein